jgi:transcription elongation factor Elf1
MGEMNRTDFFNRCRTWLWRFFGKAEQAKQSSVTRCTRCDATSLSMTADFHRVEDGAAQAVALCPSCANSFQNWYSIGRYASA